MRTAQHLWDRGTATRRPRPRRVLLALAAELESPCAEHAALWDDLAALALDLPAADATVSADRHAETLGSLSDWTLAAADAPCSPLTCTCTTPPAEVDALALAPQAPQHRERRADVRRRTDASNRTAARHGDALAAVDGYLPPDHPARLLLAEHDHPRERDVPPAAARHARAAIAHTVEREQPHSADALTDLSPALLALLRTAQHLAALYVAGLLLRASELPAPAPQRLALTRSTLTAAPPAPGMPVPYPRCAVTLAA
ncbi:MAG: hypothetical protein ACTH43_11665 [Brachybacterium sp.]|uniref:hypothetical protein n=1 Tax=Brachybacterium sp. TaxID=1891286 RepID=UPI003F901374